jgi:hypothetical protein
MASFCIKLEIFGEIVPESQIFSLTVIYPFPCFKENTAEVPHILVYGRGKNPLSALCRILLPSCPFLSGSSDGMCPVPPKRDRRG